MSSRSARAQRRTLKSEAAYKRVRERIVRCDLRPGATFTETEIIAETGIGRTPVREALAQLAHDGLVEILPRSGYRVTELNEKAVRDLFAVWRAIAPVIVMLADTATEGRRSRITAHIARLRKAQQDGWSPSEIENRGDVFDILADATNNAELFRIYRRLAGQLDRIFTLFVSTPRGVEWARAVNDGASIFLQRDHEAAAQRIVEYIDDSLAGILESLQTKKRKAA
jgi:DNA-binding GntR family transcriptional regulator